MDDPVAVAPTDRPERAFLPAVAPAPGAVWTAGMSGERLDAAKPGSAVMRRTLLRPAGPGKRNDGAAGPRRADGRPA